MEIINRKAKFDYFIEEEYEAGIVLTGTEIKSIRKGSCNIKDCYGIIRHGEIKKGIFLIMKKQEIENYYFIKKK